MAKTAISWTDHSINPIRARSMDTDKIGHYCEKVSQGCANCYASAFQVRLGTPTYGGTSGPHSKEMEPFLDESKLKEVIRRKKPTKYFWCDMTDLFGSWVPDDWIDKCFATMALTPQHTHQVLTKRPERMLEYMQSIDMGDGGPSLPRGFRIAYQADNIQPPPNKALSCWPMPNVWLGVSVEDQKRAGERIPVLLKIPAAVRFLSIEPMLGPVDLTAVKDDDWKTNPTYHPGQPMGTMHALKQFVPRDSGGTEPWGESVTELNRVHTIDWVITGCESGLGRRPWSLEWDQAIERQCRAAGVAFFRKQIVLDGRVSKDAAEWPEHLRVQEFPR